MVFGNGALDPSWLIVLFVDTDFVPKVLSGLCMPRQCIRVCTVPRDERESKHPPRYFAGVDDMHWIGRVVYGYLTFSLQIHEKNYYHTPLGEGHAVIALWCMQMCIVPICFAPQHCKTISLREAYAIGRV